MYRKLYEDYGQSTEFLPNCNINGEKELMSASSLLREFDISLSVLEFNKKMKREGFLIRKNKINNKGQLTHYNYLIDKGLSYGKNILNPYDSREIRPLYYKDCFLALVEKII